MNIKVKAGLDVVKFFGSIILAMVLIRLTLDYLVTLYGADQVINGVMFAGLTALIISAVKTMYDIRVSQLEYRAKLTDMTKK